MQQRPQVYLVVSLDVEEEGLFCNRYDVTDVKVTNTQSLTKLATLLKLGVKPTLFCAHSVLQDEASCIQLRHLWEAGCEIGAHLHHWNTPPLTCDQPWLDHVPAKELTDEQFSAKVSSVLELAKKLTGKDTTSFRMGRWDLHQKHFPLLAQLGILCDASIRPLHGKMQHSSNPNHFLAPRVPYFVPTRFGHIMEVPLTVTPIFQFLPSFLTFCEKFTFTRKTAQFLSATMNYWGALAMLPVYHPLVAMTTITRLAVQRGIDVITLTWHSSEMHPGATPHLTTENAVNKLLNKIKTYITWLMTHYDVTCVTMTELRTNYMQKATVVVTKSADWSTKDHHG